VVLAQGALTWAAFLVFGSTWQVGVGGVLAGIVLLFFSGPKSWLAAAALLVIDIFVRASLTGLPWQPAWSGALWAVVAFVDDTVATVGIIWLTRMVDESEDTQRCAARRAAATERLQATLALQAGVDERLSEVASRVATAENVFVRDRQQAAAEIVVAGATSREAVASARHVPDTLDKPAVAYLEREQPAASTIGAHVALGVVAVYLCGFGTAAINDAYAYHLSARLISALSVGTIAVIGLQVYHSSLARLSRFGKLWPVTLGLQAAIVYAFFLPPIGVYMPLAGFVAGSVLILTTGWSRRLGFVAVLITWPVLYASVALHGRTPDVHVVLYATEELVYVALLVYGLTWLVAAARLFQDLRADLARFVGFAERLRVARDVHDLLGLGLSALALKADLIGRLIGRDDERAEAEIKQMGWLCATARAQLREVTTGQHQLSLLDELATAPQVLKSAGVDVRISLPSSPLPNGLDDILAPVLREAVTNILRHSAATVCTIEIVAKAQRLRLSVWNDGAVAGTRDAGMGRPGTGLANLAGRVETFGGRLTAGATDGSRFELVVEVPVPLPPERVSRLVPARSRG
jgi:two-component system, NarL family, sensor histidine kinase DesK